MIGLWGSKNIEKARPNIQCHSEERKKQVRFMTLILHGVFITSVFLLFSLSFLSFQNTDKNWEQNLYVLELGWLDVEKCISISFQRV
jgi:hypothetical protein